jgi:hypothetical protein
MKKILAVIILILLMSLFSGCISERSHEIVPVTREFIKDYINNSDTIQFNDEHITKGGPMIWDVYGSGTVMYEGSHRSFSYWIHVFDRDNKLNCILKELIIGEV